MTWQEATAPTTRVAPGPSWVATTIVCLPVLLVASAGLLPTVGRLVDARGSGRVFLAGVLVGGVVAAFLGRRREQLEA